MVVLRGFYIGDIYDRVKDLLSISALVVVVVVHPAKYSLFFFSSSSPLRIIPITCNRHSVYYVIVHTS